MDDPRGAAGAAVIETAGLVKDFGRVRALDGLDLSVAAGEIHGFLGPNGAGKSTTIRILLGLARSTGGRARVFGLDPWTSSVEIHRRLAYVPGDVSLWPNLTGGEAIDLISRLRGGTADRAVYRERRARLLEEFELDPSRKARTYSKGNRQKVALVAAFATPADLYILDEPTSGLDPLMESVFDSVVKRARADGATVLLSSHILSEVERLCDRVSIIRSGILVEGGTLAELQHLTRTEVSFAEDSLTDDDLARIPAVHDLGRSGGRVRFTVDTEDLAAVLPVLGSLRVERLTVAPPSLEELFLRHYGADVRGAQDAPRTRSGRDDERGSGTGGTAGAAPETAGRDRADTAGSQSGL